MMELEKTHEEKILEAVRKAVQSTEYGEVRIKLDKTSPVLGIEILTQEKLRFEKNA
jgi:hypothetical protein